LVIHYDGSNQGLAGKPHSACRDYWRRTRSFHTGPSRGWADIGYSFGCCPHGYVLEGRGLNKQQAAQPGGNATWYSCTLMGGDTETPTAAQINAVRELRAWLRSKGLGAAVRGHRDFIPTSCPGPIAYRMVKDGTFTGTPTNTPQEDDVSFTDSIPVGNTYDGDWNHPTYPASFMIVAAATYGKRTKLLLDKVHREVAAQGAAITELTKAVTALAANGGDLDTDELLDRIRSEISRVVVRLDVDEEPAGSGTTQSGTNTAGDQTLSHSGD
jgi:hypothetical protein